MIRYTHHEWGNNCTVRDAAVSRESVAHNRTIPHRRLLTASADSRMRYTLIPITNRAMSHTISFVTCLT